MRIAVINETSAADRNADILKALEGRGHKIQNVGMKKGGNCVSLALNQGYGWAGDINLRFIFDRFFEVESGSGYPLHRVQAQRQSRETLARISNATHRPFYEILAALPRELVEATIGYPGVRELLDIPSLENERIREALGRVG